MTRNAVRTIRMLSFLVALSLVHVLWPTQASQQAAAVDAAQLLDSYVARNIGPANMSGRVVAIAGVESNPNIVYATVFEAAGHSPYLIRYRIDMGANTPTWVALDQPPNGPDNVPNDYRFWHVVLAVDPSDPNTIYVNGDEPDLFQARITDTTTGAVSYGLLQNVEDVVEISFDAAPPGAYRFPRQFGEVAERSKATLC